MHKNFSNKLLTIIFVFLVSFINIAVFSGQATGSGGTDTIVKEFFTFDWAYESPTGTQVISRNRAANGVPEAGQEITCALDINKQVAQNKLWVTWGSVLRNHSTWTYYSMDMSDIVNTGVVGMDVRFASGTNLENYYVVIASLEGLSIHNYLGIEIIDYYSEDDYGKTKTIQIPLSEFKNVDDKITYTDDANHSPMDFTKFTYVGLAWADPNATATGGEEITYIDNVRVYNVNPPQNVKISDASSTTLTLSWEASTSSIEEYEIHRNDGVIIYVYSDKTSYTDINLEKETNYMYKLRAKDAYGMYSNYTESAAGRTITIDKPTNFVVTDIVSVLATKLTWEAPAQGNKAVKFLIYRDGELITEVDGNETSYIDSDNILNNTEYDYYMVAIDEDGNISYPTKTERVFIRIIDPPENFTGPSGFNHEGYEEIYGSEVLLTWDEPSYGIVYKYEIYRNNELLVMLDSTVTSYIDKNNFINDMSYDYYIVSIAECGIASIPADATVKVKMKIIGKPMDLTASSILGTTTVELKWEEPEYGKVNKYLVYRDNELIAELENTVTTYIDDDGLINNQYYNYSIICLHISGVVSLPSDTKRVFVTTIASPEGFTATISDFTDKHITLEWDEVLNAESYIIYCNGVIIAKTYETEFIHMDLDYDTIYTYYVQAKSDDGVLSAPSLHHDIIISSPEAENVIIPITNMDLTFEEHEVYLSECTLPLEYLLSPSIIRKLFFYIPLLESYYECWF